MATIAPTDSSFLTARSTTPAPRGAAPDVNNLRERKSYLSVAVRVLNPSAMYRKVKPHQDDEPKLKELAEQ